MMRGIFNKVVTGFNKFTNNHTFWFWFAVLFAIFALFGMISATSLGSFVFELVCFAIQCTCGYLRLQWLMDEKFNY